MYAFRSPVHHKMKVIIKISLSTLQCWPPIILYIRSTVVLHTYPFIMYCQCFLNFHYGVGRQGLEIDPFMKFRFLQSFSLSVTCTYICHVLAETVFCCFPRNT